MDRKAGTFAAAPLFDGGKKIKITLSPVRELKISVMDSKGIPVTGAFCGAFSDRLVVARSRTDKEGVATLRVPKLPPVLPDGSDLLDADDVHRIQAVYAFADDMGLAIETWTEDTKDAALPTKLVLVGAEPITAKILDRDMTPIAGLPVYLSTYSLPIGQTRMAGPDKRVAATAISRYAAPLFADARTLTRSNSDGFARLNWYASPRDPVKRGKTVEPTQFYDVGLGAIHPEWDEGSVKFTQKIPAEVVCTVYSPSTIRLIVKLPSGDPAKGIKLQYGDHLGTNQIAFLTTDEKGRVELTAPPHEMNLRVSHSKWVADPIELASLATKSSTNDIEVKLREGKRVKFCLTAGPEFIPVPDHEFGITSAGAGKLWLRTDKNGRAEALLDRGLYQIEVHDPVERIIQDSDRFLVRDQKDIEIPIHIRTSPVRSIVLKVFEPNGLTPAAKATVHLLNLGPEHYSRLSVAVPAGASGGDLADPPRDAPAVTTDAAGKCEIKVLVEVPAWLIIKGADGACGLAKVDVPDTEVTVSLRSKVAVRGQLLNKITGAPVANTELVAQLDVAKLWQNSRIATFPRANDQVLESFRVRCTTDAKGMFQFDNLLPDAPIRVTFKNRVEDRVSAGPSGGRSEPTLHSSMEDGALFEFRSAIEGRQDLGQLRR